MVPSVVWRERKEEWSLQTWGRKQERLPKLSEDLESQWRSRNVSKKSSDYSTKPLLRRTSSRFFGSLGMDIFRMTSHPCLGTSSSTSLGKARAAPSWGFQQSEPTSPRTLINQTKTDKQTKKTQSIQLNLVILILTPSLLKSTWPFSQYLIKSGLEGTVFWKSELVSSS